MQHMHSHMHSPVHLDKRYTYMYRMSTSVTSAYHLTCRYTYQPTFVVHSSKANACIMHISPSACMYECVNVLITLPAHTCLYLHICLGAYIYKCTYMRLASRSVGCCIFVGALAFTFVCAFLPLQVHVHMHVQIHILQYSYLP